jgi:hypothetical protein
MAANPTPNPDEKLVRVFDTDGETEALVVKGLLDSAGIDAQIRGVDNTQDVLPIGGTVILVREEDEPAARQLLEDYRRSPEQEAAEEATFDAAAETAEYNTRPTEDPPEK